MDLSSCTICPRKCKVNRLNHEKGICRVEGEEIYASRAALHFYEEPCISGKNGSGAVFFSGCNLHCVYCQNAEISSMNVGMKISVERLSDIFLELQDKHAENINLVTPTHYSMQIKEAVNLSRKKGLFLPIIYNCSGYESVETLKELSDVVDIYLTDFKYGDKELSKNLSRCEDYVERAKEALDEMVSQKKISFEKNGMMKTGVIVRHLVLPGHIRNTKEVLKYVYEKYEDKVYLSIMNQYTPLREIKGYPELQRKVTKREYERVLAYALSLGITNAFIQEGNTAKESFIPAFNYEGILSEEEEC